MPGPNPAIHRLANLGISRTLAFNKDDCELPENYPIQCIGPAKITLCLCLSTLGLGNPMICNVPTIKAVL